MYMHYCTNILYKCSVFNRAPRCTCPGKGPFNGCMSVTVKVTGVSVTVSFWCFCVIVDSDA